VSAEPGACGAVLFKAFDLDSNAMIDHDEFIQLMNRMLVAGKNERMKQTDTSGMFKEIDTNGDNLVDEDEFMAWATKVRALPLCRVCKRSRFVADRCVCWLVLSRSK